MTVDADRLEDGLGVHAGLLRQHKRLRARRDVDRDDRLVGELRDVAGPDGADVGDRSGHDVEDGRDLLEHRLVAADHDGQGAVDRLGLAARDRRVEHGDADFGQFVVNLARNEWRDRGHVDVDEAFVRAFDDPVFAEGDRLDVRRVGKHRDDELRGEGSFFGVRDGGGPLGHEVIDRFLVEVVDVELMPRLDEVLGHWAAHDAEADETDLHGNLLSA